MEGGGRGAPIGKDRFMMARLACRFGRQYRARVEGLHAGWAAAGGAAIEAALVGHMAAHCPLEIHARV